jgi:hypothetical protein
VKLPLTIGELRLQVGNLRTLKQVERAKQYLSDCALSAAERQYPRLYELPEDEMLKLAHVVAKDRWPGFDELAKEVAAAERAAYLNAGAMA